MIEKSEIRCIRTLKTGPFFKEFLVYLDCGDHPRQCFQLRAMSKRLIVVDKVDEEMVMNELYVRSCTRHPFLANQICALQDYDNLFYLTEHAPLMLLKSRLLPGRFGMREIQFYAAEMFAVIRYLHTKGQIYTFLSPDNIMVDTDGHIKLDYAFCNSLNETDCDVLENIEYASLSFLTTGDFSMAGDYWSLGVVLYKMAFGYTPFGSESFDDTLNAMQTLDIEFPDYADPVFEDLVRLLLNVDRVEGRFARLEDADDIAAHPFFAGIDWQRLERREIEPPFAIKITHGNADIYNAPALSTLYTSDFIVGDKDGYGRTFQEYNTVAFLKR